MRLSADAAFHGGDMVYLSNWTETKQLDSHKPLQRHALITNLGYSSTSDSE